MGRCPPALVLGFRVGAVFDQDPCNIKITFGGYLMKQGNESISSSAAYEGELSPRWMRNVPVSVRSTTRPMRIWADETGDAGGGASSIRHRRAFVLEGRNGGDDVEEAGGSVKKKTP
jgi:hypothetical protein